MATAGARVIAPVQGLSRWESDEAAVTSATDLHRLADDIAALQRPCQMMPQSTTSGRINFVGMPNLYTERRGLTYAALCCLHEDGSL